MPVEAQTATRILREPVQAAARARQGPVQVNVSPSWLSIQSGASRQITATVNGTTNPGITWTAGLGSIDSSGIYTAPQVTTDTVDTISAVSNADGTKYTTITVLVQAASTVSPVYSLTSQPSVTNVPYPTSLVAKTLPSDIMRHLYGGCTKGTNCSDTIARTAITGNGKTGSTLWGNSFIATPGINDYDFPVYYGTSSNPTYCISSCTYHVSGANNPVGKCFHAPSGAQFGGYPSGYSVGFVDQNIIIWDETQNVEVEAYSNHSSNPRLPSCASGSTCKVSFNYCGWANRQTDKAWGNQTATTNGLAPDAGLVHGQELMQAQINHPIYLNAYCTASSVVFPDVVKANTGRTCASMGISSTNRPPNGALFFLDYTPTQLSYLKTVLPAWQYPLIQALTRYGAYLGSTGGSYDTLHVAHIESGQAYQYSGVTYPLWSFLDKNCGKGCYKGTRTKSPPYSKYIYTLNFLANIPNLSGPNCSTSSCDVTQHMHITDPCIAKGLAGMTSSQGACF